MADRTPTAHHGAPSTFETVLVILTPVWIILATLLHGLVTGEVLR